MKKGQLQLCKIGSLLLVVLIVVILSHEASSRPNAEEITNMANALRYLEELDKIYSQMARPR